MKKQSTFTKHLFTYGAMSVLFFWTAGTSVSLAQTTDAQVNEFSAIQAGTAIETAEPAAQAPDLVASTEDDMLAPAAAGTNAKLNASSREAEVEEAVVTEKAAVTKETKKVGAGQKLKSLPAKILLKTAVRKIEKVQKRMDIKAEKAAKQGKEVDQQVKVGIIVALIGLLLLIVGAFTSGILYVLGALGLVIGLVIILLAALEVI